MRGEAGLLAALVARTAAVQRQAQLLDGADDDLVGGIVRQHAPHQRAGVGVLLHAAFLEAVELLAGLAIEILAVDHEQALLDGRVGLEQRSEEHTSELQSLMRSSYAVFCLKKKTKVTTQNHKAPDTRKTNI